jgi:hypothetical protein
MPFMLMLILRRGWLLSIFAFQCIFKKYEEIPLKCIGSRIGYGGCGDCAGDIIVLIQYVISADPDFRSLIF